MKNIYEKQLEGSGPISVGTEEGQLEYLDRLRGLLTAVMDSPDIHSDVQRIIDGIEIDEEHEMQAMEGVFEGE